MKNRSLQSTDAAGLDVRRTAIGAGERTLVAGVPTTAPLRTLTDCARLGARLPAVCLIESAIRQDLVTRREIEAALDALARVRGVRAARALLADVEPASESPLETAVRLAIIDAGLPRPEPQLPFDAGRCSGRIDLAYPAALLGAPRSGRYAGLAIEADGWAFHSGRAAFGRDRIRQTALEEIGWLVRRFTDRDSPDYVVTTVRRAIECVRAG